VGDALAMKSEGDVLFNSPRTACADSRQTDAATQAATDMLPKFKGRYIT